MDDKTHYRTRLIRLRRDRDRINEQIELVMKQLARIEADEHAGKQSARPSGEAREVAGDNAPAAELPPRR